MGLERELSLDMMLNDDDEVDNLLGLSSPSPTNSASTFLSSAAAAPTFTSPFDELWIFQCPLAKDLSLPDPARALLTELQGPIAPSLSLFNEILGSCQYLTYGGVK